MNLWMVTSIQAQVPNQHLLQGLKVMTMMEQTKGQDGRVLDIYSQLFFDVTHSLQACSQDF